MSPKTENGAVICLSGGLDSTVCLAIANKKYNPIIAVYFNYGQKAAAKELAASQAIAEHYNAQFMTIDLPWFGQLLPNHLSQSNTWNKDSQGQDDFFNAQGVWVPNRNGVILNIAAAIAEANQYDTIIFGANAEEGEAFPDNTREFRFKLEDSLAYSTLNKVKLFTPVCDWNKSRMVQYARQNGVPLELIWSCYEASEAPCGHCPSCVRVNAAIEANNN